MLAYFLRHYAPLADRVVLFDDHSDDGGPDLAAAYANVEVRPYPGAGLDDIEFVRFAAATYPEARAKHVDWVVWVDADEFVYAKDLRGTLTQLAAAGVTLPLTQGFAMFSDCYPTTREQIYDEVRQGVPYERDSKPVVFNPAIDIAWGAGKHDLTQGGGERGSLTLLKLLHFRNLGPDYFAARNAKNYARMSERNKAAGLGFQVYPEHQVEHGWEARARAMRPQLVKVLP